MTCQECINFKRSTLEEGIYGKGPLVFIICSCVEILKDTLRRIITILNYEALCALEIPLDNGTLNQIYCDTKLPAQA